MSKQFKGLFDAIVDKHNIYKAYHKALKGDGKYNFEAIEFANNETDNINKLIQSLIDESYQFTGYIRFPVFEPKERIVDAPHFVDKVVQLAINNVIKDIYNPKFIFDNYACIENKGTHKCVERIHYFMRKARWQYGESAYIVKIDIKKYFYSIDRNILKQLLRKTIACQKTLRLMDKIIDSADMISELGLPLGNTLSQICANIYLNEMDQYAKRKLSLKYYVRYMDDIMVIVEDKDTARAVLKLLNDFATTRLNLVFNHKKTKIFPIMQGVNSIGFKILPTHRLLRNDCKKKIKRKVKAMPSLIASKQMTVTKAEQILNSWYGHAKHGNSYNFINKLIEINDFICFDGKSIKVRETQYG